MRFLISKIISQLVIAAVFAAVISAQVLPTASSFVGEKLSFDAKGGKSIIHGLDVGEVTFSFDKDASTGNYLVRSNARSKGSFTKMFGLTVVQEYETLIDSKTFDVLRTSKHDVQRDRIRNSVADFNYAEHRVTFVETDPNDPNRAPRKIASDITSPLNDLVSGLYRIRTMPLSVGRSFKIDVSDTGIVYSIPVKVVAREQLKTALGKVWAFRVEPEIFGIGHLIEQKGSMSIWITDDEKRIPVRALIKIKWGKVDVKIRSVEKLT